MDAFYLLLGLAACVVVVSWARALAMLAAIETENSEGLFVRPMLGARRLIAWSEIEPPIRVFRKSLVRGFAIRTRSKGFFSMQSNVFVRAKKERMDSLAASLGAYVKLHEIRSFADLFREPKPHSTVHSGSDLRGQG